MGFSVVVFCGAGLLTSLWLGGFIVYISAAIGWGDVLFLPPADAVILALGACVPIFIVWGLVALVHIALTRSRHDLLFTTLSQHVCRITEHVEAQMRTLIQMQAKNEQKTEVGNIRLALNDLNSHAALLAERSGVVNVDEIDGLWKRVEAGDLWAFAQVFLVRSAAYPDFTSMLADRIAADSLSETAVLNFNRRFKDVRHLLSRQEEHQLLIRLFEEGPLAQVHVLFGQLLTALATLRQAGALPRDAEQDSDTDQGSYAFDGFTVERRNLSPDQEAVEESDMTSAMYSEQSTPYQSGSEASSRVSP